MFVIDLFKNTSFDEIWNILEEYIIEDFQYMVENYQEKLPIIKQRYFDLYNDILNTKPNYDKEHILICHLTQNSYEEKAKLNNVLYIRNNVINNFITYEHLEKEMDSNMDIKTIEQHLDNYITKHAIERYGIIFEPWENILGFCVPSYLVDKFQSKQIVFSIFREMTFFGDEEDKQEELDKMQNSIKAIEEREKELSEEEYLSIDEVFRRLGIKDTRTQEEKDMVRKESLLCSLKNIKIEYNDIKELYNYLMQE